MRKRKKNMLGVCCFKAVDVFVTSFSFKMWREKNRLKN